MQYRSSSPQVGDIVFSRIPETGGNAKGKLRPALVLDVTTQNGLPYLLVAKGTSQRVEERFSGEFAVQDKESITACGLHEPTKFKLHSTEHLPYTDTWFVMKVYGRVPQANLKDFRDAAREAGLI